MLLIQPGFAEIYGSFRHLYKRGFLNPPLSLAYLAAALEQAGHHVDLIDAEAEALTLAQLAARAQAFAPQLIGYTATSVDYAQAVAAARRLKQTLPQVPAIIGGVHANLFGAQILAEEALFDYAARGDGEPLITALADALTAPDASLSARLAAIPGLIFRNADGAVTANPPGQATRDLDAYPHPARRLLKDALYIRAIPRQGYVVTASSMTSRGCPYGCVYCAIDALPEGRLTRFRSAANVLEELEEIVNGRGVTHVAFNDDCLTLKPERIFELCEGIHARGLKFTWEGLSRGDLVTPELLRAMRRAGMTRLSFGIESGDPQILATLNKGETLAHIEAGLRWAKEAGIVTRGSVIIGLPHETRASVRRTFRYITGLKTLDQVNINILQPYPGTEVARMTQRGVGGARLIAPEVADNPLAAGGQLRRFGSASVTVNDLTPKRLARLQKQGFFRFYLRPRAMWNNLKIAGWRVCLQDGVGLLRSLVGS
ncbi:putative radical SAM protein [Magnetofaba australis IT-1]|uniref:Putative radical SAM protein n=1 Tax=Magnetofaba australis IT-1 TaxID=1434232 RepID=A0A1Y2K1T6_9PROT|nr:putative radical SAM protein [Magnetofaba australis IT-1]